MLTCYIIDDELHAIKSLINHIEKTPSLQLIGYEHNPIEALSFLKSKDIYPDIVFLDVEMPHLSGIELAALIQGKTTVVLTTAHPSFALEAFDREVTDYLLKPIPFSRFLKCITRINERLAQEKPKEQNTINNYVYIQTEGKGKLMKLFFQNIIVMESQKNYVAITTSTSKHLTYLTLSELENKLPSTFLRVNKSYVINTDKITHVEGNEVFLEGQKQSIPIGISYKESFLNYVNHHLVKTKR